MPHNPAALRRKHQSRLTSVTEADMKYPYDWRDKTESSKTPKDAKNFAAVAAKPIIQKVILMIMTSSTCIEAGRNADTSPPEPRHCETTAPITWAAGQPYVWKITGKIRNSMVSLVDVPMKYTHMRRTPANAANALLSCRGEKQYPQHQRLRPSCIKESVGRLARQYK